MTATKRCGSAHPNLLHVVCDRFAARPRGHVGPCAKTCVIEWITNEDGTLRKAWITDIALLKAGADRCPVVHPKIVALQCELGRDHSGACAKRIVLEWYVDIDGKLQRSAVVNGRTGDLEARYGGSYKDEKFGWDVDTSGGDVD